MHSLPTLGSLRSFFIPLILSVIASLSCAPETNINDAVLIGPWQATGLNTGTGIESIDHGQIYIFRKDYTFSLYDPTRRGITADGRWQLSKSEKETMLILSWRGRTEFYSLLRNGDNLTFTRAGEAGMRPDITFYERYDAPSSQPSLLKRIVTWSPAPDGSGAWIFWIIAIAFFALLLYVRWLIVRDRNLTVLSRWHQLYENMTESSQETYRAMEEAIRKRNLPQVRLARINHHEGGIFSAKREYLRVKRKELIYDICAAPYGNGFFFSWWLCERPSSFWALVTLIPLIGIWLCNTLRPYTYYRMDTVAMFQDSVHSAVLEVVDDMTKAKGLRALTELERKPILKRLFEK